MDSSTSSPKRMCLMANDEEINFISASSYSSIHDSDSNCVHPIDSVFKLIKDFKNVKVTESKLMKGNS